MKKNQLQYSNYILFTACCICVLTAPIILEFVINYINPNNSHYINSLHSKHYIILFFTAILFAGLITIPILFIKKRIQIIYSILLSVFIGLPSLIECIHVLLFNSGTNSSSWYSVIGTNTNEAIEFIFDYSSIRIIWGILLFILLPLTTFYFTKRILASKLKKGFYILYIVGFTCVIAFNFLKSDSTYFKEISIVKFYNSYRDYRNDLKAFTFNQNCKQKILVTRKNALQKETHIIIIGESTSKYHMEIYGYNRATTPELEKLKNNLLLFSNVKASYAHTIESLMQVFQVSNDCSFIDVCNAAGAKTFWLSNQKFLGENETMISAIANSASKKIFINPTSDNKYDEELLPELDKLLQDTASRKVIFIHLMGTHLSYQDRYPKDFKHFNTPNISPFGDNADSFINDYDNANLYNDYVVSKIIKKCASLNYPSTTTYFSDHGDEVFDFRDFHGHAQVLLSQYMTDVPFMIYLNNSFQKTKSFYIDSIHFENDFSLQQFSNTIQDLLGYQSQYFDKTKSYLYANSQIKPEASKKQIIPFTSKLLPKYTSKIWAHRVNSIERLNSIKKTFTGIELDVQYIHGKFDVGHPPTPSIGLSLETYFKSIKNIDSYYFWLDLKNLDSKNVQQVITELNKISNVYHNKQNLIVETSNPELIPQLEKAGYNASYYLPDIANCNEKNRINTINKIAKNITKYHISTISQSIENYGLMKENFPNTNKLIWALQLDWNETKTHIRIENILAKDTTIKVCLVNYSSNGWR